jgi:hypothetical protein
MPEADDKKRSEQRKRERRRTRLQSAFSWGTVLTAIAGFFTIWHNLGQTQVGSSSSQSASQQITPDLHSSW